MINKIRGDWKQWVKKKEKCLKAMENDVLQPKKNLKLVKELGPYWKETFVDGHLKKEVKTWL